jgi:hypothetical protein
VSLEDQDTHGRLDVLAYRMSQRVIEELETFWQTPGLWNMLKGHVEEAIEDVKVRKVPEPILTVVGKLIEAGRKK